jgi:hypothetical protein
MDRKKIASAMAGALFLTLVAGCGPKKEGKYKIEEQTPAAFITAERGPADTVRHDESACPLLAPVGGGAYAYLQALLEAGPRESGGPGARCASAWLRQTLAGLGYEVSELSYSFPYYHFDLEAVEVRRWRDGRVFPY